MNYVNVFDQCANVAQMARGCPTPTLRRAYVTAMRDWCAQTQWLRVNATGATVAGQALYDLGSDDYLEIVGLYAVSGQDSSYTPPAQWNLAASNPGGWNPMIGQSQPLSFAYVPEGQMALNPTPDAVYGITYTAIVQPKEGVTVIPDSPLVKYSTGIEAGALAYLLAMKDVPWSNPAEAKAQQRTFGAYISNGKAEVQRNFNPGSQRAQPRLFGVGFIKRW